jgi:hypothetical protein
MSVNETRGHRPLGEVDHPRSGWALDRAFDLRNPVVSDENLCPTGQGIGETVEHISAHQNEQTHLRAFLAPSFGEREVPAVGRSREGQPVSRKRLPRGVDRAARSGRLTSHMTPSGALPRWDLGVS